MLVGQPLVVLPLVVLMRRRGIENLYGMKFEYGPRNSRPCRFSDIAGSGVAPVLAPSPGEILRDVLNERGTTAYTLWRQLRWRRRAEQPSPGRAGGQACRHRG